MRARRDTTVSARVTSEELAGEISAIYAQWFTEVLDDSWDFFDQHLADDWVYTNFLGEVRSKGDYRGYIAHVPANRMPRSLRNVIARPVGGVVIAHGEYLSPGGADDVEHLLRFTSVWDKSSGRWRCLTHHTTVVSDPI